MSGSGLQRTLLIAAGALAIGVAGAYVLDLHSHECERCGHRWSHLGAFNAGAEPAHTCARCGALQWWKVGVPPHVRELYERVHAAAHAPTPQGPLRPHPIAYYQEPLS